LEDAQAHVTTRWEETVTSKNVSKHIQRKEEAKRGRTPELAKARQKEQDRAAERAADAGVGIAGLMRDCMFPPVRRVQDECFGDSQGLGVNKDGRPAWAMDTSAYAVP
jgi:hypothetical protein